MEKNDASFRTLSVMSFSSFVGRGGLFVMEQRGLLGGGGYNVVAGLIGIARRRISHKALSFPPFVSVLQGDYAKAPTMDMPAAVEKNCVSLLHCYTNIGDSNCVTYLRARPR